MRITNLPEPVVENIRNKLRRGNKRRLSMASKIMRSSGCTECTSERIWLRLVRISPRVVHEGREYSCTLEVEIDLTPANDHYIREMGSFSNSVSIDGQMTNYLVGLKFHNQPWSVRIQMSRGLPTAVKECFATCIVRGLHRHRERLLLSALGSHTQIFTGPVTAAQMNHCLNNVKVKTLDF